MDARTAETSVKPNFRAHVFTSFVLCLGLLIGSAAAVFAQLAPDDNPMRSMMRGMMRGLVPPPGMTPEALPDSDSPGAKLVARFCVQCHDLPSPRYKTADQWPLVFDRMLGRMRMMSGEMMGGMMGGGMMGGGMMGGGMMMGMRLEAPDAAEANALLEYLQGHAMREARPEELVAGNSADRTVFRRTCSQCHVLPSPSMQTHETWPGIVARMQVNERMMARPELTREQGVAIARFLQAASRTATNP